MENNIKKYCYKPPHFPFEDPSLILSMGLQKVPDSEWFEVFDLKERALQLVEKRKLLARIPEDIFMADTSALSASKVVLDLMINNLTKYKPDLYALKNKIIKLKSHENYSGEEFSTDLIVSKLHPLDIAARLVQEDLIIMLPPNKEQKGWWLAAGSLAFPSRWNLRDKFRKTMDTIHSPVPFYKDKLKIPTNKFFDQMPNHGIFSRRNWSIHDSPSLRQDGITSMLDKTKINSSNAGEHLWLRVERQTLRKLKSTEAILFTIRIHIRSLKEIVKYQGVAKKLNKALSALPSEMLSYKQANIFFGPLQEYLSRF